MSDITPQNDFEQAILDVFTETAYMVIEKNRLYGDSYRTMRERAKFELKNAGAPFWIHINEKISRYMNQIIDEANRGLEAGTDTNLLVDIEDPLKDGMGYFGLELVCRRFDDVNN